jgi:hypothetical protein
MNILHRTFFNVSCYYHDFLDVYLWADSAGFQKSFELRIK